MNNSLLKEFRLFLEITKRKELIIYTSSNEYTILSKYSSPQIPVKNIVKMLQTTLTATEFIVLNECLNNYNHIYNLVENGINPLDLYKEHKDNIEIEIFL